MVVLVLTAVVSVAGALVLLAELVSVRAAAAGRAGAEPLVAQRGARFGDATRAERAAARRRLRVVTQVPTAGPAAASAASAGPATSGPATSGHRAA